MIGRLASNPTGRTLERGRSSLRRAVVSLLAAALLPTWAGVANSTARAQTASPPQSAPAKKATREPSKTQAKPPASTLPVDAPSAMDDPGSMVLPPPSDLDPSAPRRDPQVIPAAIGEPPADPSEGGNPLPKAIAPAEGAGSASGSKGTGGEQPDPFSLRPDRYPTGKQQVKLSVEVRAGAVINLGKESTVRIVVNNEGTTDAFNVRVTYQLPDGLQFVSSESPETKDPANPQIYYWNKSMLAANGEWSIGLKVVAKDTKACEHVASVTAQAGSKANTTVQEPKLKVDVRASTGRLLKGKQVNFEIIVRNPGTGPARNVNVQAKLSDGLKLGEDELVEQMIDVIKPGESVTLDPLIVDTVLGGKQTCVVDARSPDVNLVPAEHQVSRIVEVTQPALTIDLTGQNFRYTGQPTEYKVTVTNTGTAPALGVIVSAALPQQGGKLSRGPAPAGSIFDPKTRKLFWKIGQLEPGQSFESKFNYDTSSPGLYRCSAEAVSGQLRASKQMNTDVSGIADLDLKVTQTDRVIDVGKTTYYDFVIKNVGTKEATKIQLRGTLINLKVNKTFCDESTGKVAVNADAGNGPAEFIFPEIPRIPAGQSVTLSLEVEALRGGKASASVSLAHDDMGSDENSRIKGAITTTVTDNNRPAPRSSSPSP